MRSRPATAKQDAAFDYIRRFAQEFQRRQLTLDLAGILFVAAVEHAARGNDAYRKLKAKLGSFKNIFAEIGSLEKERAARKQLKGVTEDQLIDTLQEIRRLETLYEPVVSEYSLAIVAAAASAEAFINEVAEVVITERKPREHFDRLAVQAKWLFLPRLIGKKSIFDFGSEPLQTFDALIRKRNALLHFKGSSQRLDSAGAISFLEDLGLSPKPIEQSIAAVRELIRQFSLAWKGGSGPDWLYTDRKTFRRPCFYLGNREAGSVLWADELDKHRFD